MGKKSSKTKTTTTPWAPAQPYILGAASGIQNVVNQNAPNLQSLTNQLTSQLGGLNSQAFGEQPGLGAANQFVQDTLGGNYLNSNPNVEALAHQAEQDAGNTVNATFSRYGRTGSQDNAQALARGVAQAGNQVRFQNYQNERGLQNQAAGLLPSLTQAQYAGVTPALTATQLAGQLPYYGVGALSSMGNLFGGYGTSTGKQPGGWGTDLLGAGIAALPFIPGISERDAKSDIERIGEWDGRGDGLGRYRFRYKFDPSNTINEGVMADEVEKLRPWALGEKLPNGWRTVNYAKLSEAA